MQIVEKDKKCPWPEVSRSLSPQNPPALQDFCSGCGAINDLAEEAAISSAQNKPRCCKSPVRALFSLCSPFPGSAPLPRHQSPGWDILRPAQPPEFPRDAGIRDAGGQSRGMCSGLISSLGKAPRWDVLQKSEALLQAANN